MDSRVTVINPRDLQSEVKELQGSESDKLKGEITFQGETSKMKIARSDCEELVQWKAQRA